MENLKRQILKSYNFRHACKEFNGSKIPDDDFNFILETARQSPSSFGFEPWRFLVVESPGLREKIASVSWGVRRQMPNLSHLVVILARKKPDMIYSSEYITDMMENIHHLPQNISSARRDKYEDFQRNDFKLLEDDRAIFDWACKQTYIALANMMTSAAMIGIDSCAIEGYNTENLEKVLTDEGVLDTARFGVSCMAAFGYRKKEPRSKTRQPMERIVEWIR